MRNSVTRCRFLLDVETFALQHEIFHMNHMWNVNPVRSVRKCRRVPHRNTIHQDMPYARNCSTRRDTSWSTTRSLELVSLVLNIKLDHRLSVFQPSFVWIWIDIQTPNITTVCQSTENPGRCQCLLRSVWEEDCGLYAHTSEIYQAHTACRWVSAVHCTMLWSRYPAASQTWKAAATKVIIHSRKAVPWKAVE